MTGDHFESLMADMELAVGELRAPFERDPSLWTRGRAGRWTAGQHADHIANALALSATFLERNVRHLRDDKLRPPHGRWPVQAFFVRFMIGGGRLPRGAKSPKIIVASEHPEQAEVLARLARDVARHRAIGAGLSVEERDRLWVVNPFRTNWHYRFPEMLRMHAVHARHHARQIEQIAAA
jgi:hypothetical protein